MMLDFMEWNEESESLYSDYNYAALESAFLASI